MKRPTGETASPAHFHSYDADPLVGLVVDGFEIQSLIGEGSMGDVYRGLHTVIAKPVAIKVLKPELAQDSEMVDRLLREARAVNAINHPGIVNVFGFGTIPNTNRPFIVMDLLEGEPLDALLARAAPLPLKTVYSLLEELLLAIGAAHKVGVIHRDLKPGNVFLERGPESRYHAKLLDFGLARQAQYSGGSIAPTRPGMIMGTPAFMAPEQILGQKIGPHTDLYAIGGIAYQMATGRFPHEAEGSMQILSLKLRSDPPTPSGWNSQIPQVFERWIMELLTRDPDLRPRSADEVRETLIAIRDARKSTGAHARITRHPESASIDEPKTILHTPGQGHPFVRPRDPVQPSAPILGTQHAWANQAPSEMARVKIDPSPLASMLPDGSSSPPPIALLIALAVSVVTIAAGLWWLFNS